MSVAGINETRPYLTFILSKELFAIDVARVREILDLTEITPLTNAPNYVAGVFSLRGNKTPVIDLHSKFGIEKTGENTDECLIVLEAGGGGKSETVAVLADGVQEVFELEPEQINPVERGQNVLKDVFFKGKGKRNEKLIMITDTDTMFRNEELTELVKLTRNSEG
jgi:purine-binding chemotaxis protein CheW